MNALALAGPLAGAAAINPNGENELTITGLPALNLNGTFSTVIIGAANVQNNGDLTGVLTSIALISDDGPALLAYVTDPSRVNKVTYRFVGSTITFGIVSATESGGLVTANITSTNFSTTVASNSALQVQAQVVFNNLVVNSPLVATQSAAPNGTTITLDVSSGPGTAPLIFNVGQALLADAIGSVMKVTSSTPAAANAAINIDNIGDYGAATFTIPTIPTGYNTNFIGISSSDNASWGGVGTINGTTGATSIAWVKKPSATGATTGSIWIVANGNASIAVADTLATAGGVNTVSTLLFPELTGNITYGTDGLGGSAATARFTPLIDSEIAAKIGSVAAFESGTQVSTSTTAILTPAGQIDVSKAGALAFWQTITGSSASTLPTAALAPLAQYSWIAQSPSSSTVPYPGVAVQYNTVQVPLSGAALYFNFTSLPSWATNAVPSNQIYVGDSLLGQSPLFTFQPPPLAAIDKEIAANSVNSLNTLQGPVSILAGSGVTVATSVANKTITIGSTASGGNITGSTAVLARQASSNQGVSAPVNYVANLAPGNNLFGVYVLPMEVQTDQYTYGSGSGQIAGVQIIDTNPTNNSTYGNGLRYPQTLTYNRTGILFTLTVNSLNFTITTASPVANYTNYSSWLFEFIIAAPSTVVSGQLLPTKADNPIAFFNSASDDDAFLPVIPPPTFTVSNTSGNTYNITIGGGGVWALADNENPVDYIGSNIDYCLWMTARSVVNNTTIINSTGPVSLTNANWKLNQQIFLQTTNGGGGGSAGTLQQTLNLGNTATDSGSNIASIILNHAANNTNTVLSAVSGLSTNQVALNGSTSGNIAITAPATTANYAVVLPASQGNNGQQITNDGSGNLSWFNDFEVVQAVAVNNVATLSGSQTVDGYVLQVGDFCLLTNQTTASLRGLYQVQAGAWTKQTTFTWQQLFVQKGTALASSTWVKTSTSGNEVWIASNLDAINTFETGYGYRSGTITSFGFTAYKYDGTPALASDWRIGNGIALDSAGWLPPLGTTLITGVGTPFIPSGGTVATDIAISFTDVGASTVQGGQGIRQIPRISSFNYPFSYHVSTGLDLLLGDGVALDGFGRLTAPGPFSFIQAAATVNVPTLSGPQVIDGYSAVAGDIVLLSAQTTASQQGLYTVQAGTWTKNNSYINQEVFTLQGVGNIGKTFARSSASGNEVWQVVATSTGGSGGTLNYVTNASTATTNLVLNAFSGTNTFTIAGTSVVNLAAGNNIAFNSNTNTFYYTIQSLTVSGGNTTCVVTSIITDTVAAGAVIYKITSNSTTPATAISAGPNIYSQITGGTLQLGSSLTPTFQTASVLSAPVLGTDVARLADLQASAQGFFPQTPARVVATTSFGTTYINNSGVVAPFATLSGTNASGQTLVIDGVTLAINDRILFVAQGAITGAAANVSNGTYTLTANATGGLWTATRTSTVPKAGNSYYISAGTTGINNVWVNSTSGTITVGTTPIIFNQFSQVQSAALPPLNTVLQTGKTAITANSNLTLFSDAINPLTFSLSGGNVRLTQGTSAIVLQGSTGGVALGNTINAATFDVNGNEIASTIALVGTAGSGTLTLDAPSAAVSTITHSGELRITSSTAGGLISLGYAASGRNYLQTANTPSLSTVSLYPAGTDAVQNIDISGRGASGVVRLGSNGGTNFVTVGGSSTIPTITAVGSTNTSLNIAGSGTGSVSLCSQLANYITVSGAAAGSNPAISVAGTGTALNLVHAAGSQVNIGVANGFVAISGATTGAALIQPTGANVGLTVASNGTGATIIGQTATQTGWTSPGTSTTQSIWTATGSGSNIDAVIQPKGTGWTWIGNTGTYSGISINGALAGYTQITAQGPNATIDIVLQPKSSASAAGNFYPIGGTLSATAAAQPRIAVASQLGSSTLSFGTGLQVLRSNSSSGAPFWSAVGGTWYGRLGAGTSIPSSDTTISATVVSNSLPSYVSFASGALTNNSSFTITVSVSYSLALTNSSTAAPPETDMWVAAAGVRYAQIAWGANDWLGSAGAWSALRSLNVDVPLAAGASVSCLAFSNGAVASVTGSIFGGFTTTTIFTVL